MTAIETLIHEAKAERRKQLARLPVEEKIAIIEKLQAMGRAMRKARPVKVEPKTVIVDFSKF